jgi:hypothetical protein
MKQIKISIFTSHIIILFYRNIIKIISKKDFKLGNNLFQYLTY